MSLPTDLEDMCLAASRDLRVIEALARRPGHWDADVSEMALYLVGRIRDLEAQEHGRKVAIERLLNGEGVAR